jgi:hypothetical protein
MGGLADFDLLNSVSRIAGEAPKLQWPTSHVPSAFPAESPSLFRAVNYGTILVALTFARALRFRCFELPGAADGGP